MICFNMIRPLPKGPYRRIWALSWPTILSNLTVPMLGLVDTAVMGHLPDTAYIAGVAVGAGVVRVHVIRRPHLPPTAFSAEGLFS